VFCERLSRTLSATVSDEMLVQLIALAGSVLSSTIVGLDNGRLSRVRTLSDMGTLLVEEANVVAHELQDFGGIRTAGPVAFDV
jgi:hypothetical protein